MVESAQSNAEYKGLEADSMRVKIAAAHRGRIEKSFMPRAQGRSSPWNEQTTNIEVILEEVEAFYDGLVDVSEWQARESSSRRTSGVSC